MWEYINAVYWYSRFIMNYLHLEDFRCGSQSTKYSHYRITTEITTRNNLPKLKVKLSFKTTLGCHDHVFLLFLGDAFQVCTQT